MASVADGPRRRRLGRGEYEYLGEAREEARGIFLQRVLHLVPDVLTDLRTLLPLHEAAFVRAIPDEPAEAYLARIADVLWAQGFTDGHLVAAALLVYYPWAEDLVVFGQDARSPELPLLPRHTVFEPDGGPEGLIALHDALALWALKWHLEAEDGWVIQAALHQLGDWRFSHTPRSGNWGNPEVVKAERQGHPVPLPFTQTVEGWRPALETRVAAKARIRAEIDRQLEHYLDRVAQDETQAGGQTTPAKWQFAHFDWLVRYQIQGYGYWRIARPVDPNSKTVDIKAVTVAVQQMSALIGLPVRLAKRGRPRKDQKR